MSQSNSSNLPPGRPESTLLWAGALLALLVLGSLWCGRHLGMSLVDAGWAAPLLAVVYAASPIVAKLLPKDGHSTLARLGAELQRLILRPFPVLAGFLLLAVLAATRTSLAVVGATMEGNDAVRIVAVDGDFRDSAQTGAGFIPARFLGLGTGPFGREYRVEAKGYVPVLVSVPPVTGRTLRLGADVPITPAIHIRPSPLLMSYPGWFAVDRVTAEGRKRVIISCALRPVMLGHYQRPSFRPEWDWELATLDPGRRGSTILSWMQPERVEPSTPIQPGAELEVSAYAAQGMVGRTRVHVRGERLIDVSLNHFPVDMLTGNTMGEAGVESSKAGSPSMPPQCARTSGGAR